MDKTTKRILAQALVAAITALTARADITYQITDDTYMDSASPTFNYGARTTERVAINSSSACRTIFALPSELWSYAQGDVTSAVVSFYVWNDSSQSYGVSLYPMVRGFVEGTGTGSATGDGATWNTYDGVNPWTSAGGDFDASRSVLGVKGTLGVNPADPSGRFFTWDITSLLNDPTARSELQSYGAMLHIDETVPPSGQRFDAYTSSDSVTYTAPYLPSLILGVIPEPSSMLLLLAGLPLARSLRRRSMASSNRRTSWRRKLQSSC